MEKASQKVTKDPRRVEQGKKSYETCMKRLKEKILEDNQPLTPSTSSFTCNPSSSTSSSTCHPTPSTSSPTRDPTPSTSSSTCGPTPSYVYGSNILAVLAISACVFLTYNTVQPKKLINDLLAAQLEQKQPSKIRHIL